MSVPTVCEYVSVCVGCRVTGFRRMLVPMRWMYPLFGCQVLGKPVGYEAVPPEAYLAKLPKFMREYVQHSITHGKAALPLSTDIATLTGHHTSYEEFLARPENRAKFS